MVDQAELISAAQAGDRSAFDELVRQTYVDTYTLAVRLCSDEEDARDVVQDAYLRAWRSIGRFRGDAAFSTWMYRITANCASTFVAKRRRLRTEPLLTHHEPADLHPESQPEGMLESSARAGPGEPRRGRAAAPAAGGRRAEGRLRPAPRGDRRGARDLGLGGQGPPAPGPPPPARRAVRGDEVVSCGLRTSPTSCPGIVDGTVRVDETHPAVHRVGPALPGRAGPLPQAAPDPRAAPDPLLRAVPGPARRDPRRRWPRRASAGWSTRSSPAAAWPTPAPPSAGSPPPAPPPPRSSSPAAASSPAERRNEARSGSWANLDLPAARARRAVAQLVELRSPKPTVGGSSPSCPAGYLDRTTTPRISICTNTRSETPADPREAAFGEPTDQAHDGEARRRTSRARPSARPRRRPSPGSARRPSHFFSEVRGELRKVAWPTRQEVINSTIVVLIAVVVMTALIFGFDYASAKAVLFLYG